MGRVREYLTNRGAAPLPDRIGTYDVNATAEMAAQALGIDVLEAAKSLSFLVKKPMTKPELKEYKRKLEEARKAAESQGLPPPEAPGGDTTVIAIVASHDAEVSTPKYNEKFGCKPSTLKRDAVGRLVGSPAGAVGPFGVSGGLSGCVAEAPSLRAPAPGRRPLLRRQEARLARPRKKRQPPPPAKRNGTRSMPPRASGGAGYPRRSGGAEARGDFLARRGAALACPARPAGRPCPAPNPQDWWPPQGGEPPPARGPIRGKQSPPTIPRALSGGSTRPTTAPATPNTPRGILLRLSWQPCPSRLHISLPTRVVKHPVTSYRGKVSWRTSATPTPVESCVARSPEALPRSAGHDGRLPSAFLPRNTALLG